MLSKMVPMLKCYKPSLPLCSSPPIFTSKASIFTCKASIFTHTHKILTKNLQKSTAKIHFSSSLSDAESKSRTGLLSNGDEREGKNGKLRELWLYNTMSKQKEFFKSKVEGKVGMYVCGVTAYDFSHIGHARVYVSVDVLFRSNFYLIVCFCDVGIDQIVVFVSNDFFF